MVDNMVTKPLAFVLIITAQMVFNDHSQAEVFGILGTDIALQFTFENVTTNRNFDHFALYVEGNKKIVECSPTISCAGVFDVNGINSSLFYHIRNLEYNHSQVYYVSLFSDSIPKESNKVRLTVRELNRTSTEPTNSTTIGGGGSSSGTFSRRVVTVLVVSPVLLLAAVFPWLIWCLLRTKDTQQQTPAVQESAEASHQLPAPSLVYSVLDFPKRPQTALEMNPNDTEYAAVSYPPEKRRV